MTIKLSNAGSLCCLDDTDNNSINGVLIDSSDFGDQFDNSPHTAEDYGCGNMSFDYKVHTKAVLAKYNIDIETYDEIADQLEEVLSFGACGWCV